VTGDTAHELPDSVAGYSFQDRGLLREALTHPSLSGRHNYQRLEFLGDRVLGLVIAEALFERFGSDAEGKLNRRLSALVRGETVARVVADNRLDRLILMTPGAEQEGTRTKPSVLGDIGEAIIGAIYLDGGLPPARDWILRHWADLFDTDAKSAKDYKTQLQEWAQARGGALPDYSVADRSGPDHAPVFTVRASLDGYGYADAQGPSKKIAEQKAADALLQSLSKKGKG